MAYLVDLISKMVVYNAERDFYAKHFPGVHARNELTFRKMRKIDIRDIHAIETVAYEFPWEEIAFHDCLSVGYSCWVGEHAGTIASYGILSVGAGEAHVLNVCVDPASHRRGFGRHTMNFLIDSARSQRADSMFLEVRPSNKNAIRLYHSMGFNEIGTRKGYYPAKNGREDALMLALAL